MNIFDLDSSDFNYMLAQVGKDLLLNGSTTIRALLSSTPVNADNHDDKYISTLSPIKQGDLVDYINSKWLVVSQVNGQRISNYKGIMRKSNYSIKFNFTGNIKSFPAIISTKTLDIETGTYISMPVGKIIVQLQNNTDSRDIILGQRFLIMGSAWEVSGIDKSVEGTIILNSDLDTILGADDAVNEIANRWTYETTHTYVLTIVNGETASINMSDIYTVTANVTDNGTTMTNPDITFLSSDSNIASVDNLGQVMGISLGNATITAKMTNNLTILDTIAITVQEAPVEHVYTIAITTGPATIKINQTGNFVCTVYDNGVEVTDQPATWSIHYPNPDGTSTAYASVTSQTGNSAAVKAANNSAYVNKYFLVECTLNSDTSINTTKQVQVKSLF
ncbi:MAG: Ig-like domain-containing protein [Bacteroidales bacterium]|nr:Ig-like domain-containing protein [Bacteroidales bacterium]